MTTPNAPRCTECGKIATQQDIDGAWWPPCEHAKMVGLHTLEHTTPNAPTAAEAVKCPDCGTALRHVAGEDWACPRCKDPQTQSGQRYWRVVQPTAGAEGPRLPWPNVGRVQAIADRAKAATPGPWAFAQTCEKGYGANVGAGCFAEDDMDCKRPLSGDLTDSGDYYVDQPIATLDHQKAGPDAAFIAHAREDVPWLILELSAAIECVGENAAALLAARREVEAARAALKAVLQAQHGGVAI